MHDVPKHTCTWLDTLYGRMIGARVSGIVACSGYNRSTAKRERVLRC